MVETSVGRVIVNGIIPKEVGYVNKIVSKKSLRDIIADVIKNVGFAEACEFLDGIKNLGYRMAYEAGLSFNLDDIIIPESKKDLIEKGNAEVQQITENYIFNNASITCPIFCLVKKVVGYGVPDDCS